MRDGLRRLIVSGSLPLGEKLPSVRELSTQLTINPNTIQRAYRELETEGYICSVAGRGSYVCAQIPDDPARQVALLQQFDAAVQELLYLGMRCEELRRRTELLNRQEDNNRADAAYPRLTSQLSSNNTQSSTFYIHDAKYLRLKTVELGYTIKKLRVYLSGNNLFVISPFDYWDPEKGGGHGLSYPLQRTAKIGVQYQF